MRRCAAPRASFALAVAMAPPIGPPPRATCPRTFWSAICGSSSELGLINLAVNGTSLHQLLMRSFGRDAPFVQDQDLVCSQHGADTLGDDEDGALAVQAQQRFLDTRFGIDVDRTRTVVQDENARLEQQGSGDGDTLLLTPREVAAAFLDHCVISL